MPRPPLLPTIDWQNIFNNGKTWEGWLDGAESPEQAGRMRERFAVLPLPEDSADCLASIARPVYVIAIAEDWCGDVVRHAPVLARISHDQPKVQVRFISRGDYPDLFARFLTNGGEAIPKFVFLSSDWVECGNWGPMQADCRLLVSRGKACNNVAAARERVSDIYQGDPGCRTVFHELCQLVELAAAQGVE